MNLGGTVLCSFHSCILQQFVVTVEKNVEIYSGVVPKLLLLHVW